jgi:hypothetical protein
VTQALVTAALAPLLGSPDLRAELVSQAPLGHALEVLEERGEFLKAKGEDGYAGWVHRGYLLTGPDAVVDEWKEEARWSSLGAALSIDGRTRMPVPLGSRLGAEPGGAVRLPDGRIAQVAQGRVAPLATLREEARAMNPADWAEVFFAGAPYLWGGLTPWGVDCSGLVRVTYWMRGVSLPRDSRQQARAGKPVPARDALHRFEPGDLLFFGEDQGEGLVAHVAIAGGDGTVVHSALAAGGVCRSPLGGESEEAARLRETFLLARRA